MNAEQTQTTEPTPATEQDAVVIPFPGTPQPPAGAIVKVVNADPNHWSRTLPRGRHIAVYSDLLTIYGTVGAAVATGLVIRALAGGAL